MPNLVELRTALDGLSEVLGEQRGTKRELTDAEKKALKAILKLMQDETEKARDLGLIMMELSPDDFSNLPDDVAYPVRDAGVDVNHKVTDLVWNTFEKVGKQIIKRYGDQIGVKDFTRVIESRDR